MFLKNQLVYIQFHPVTYMVKLNIEMSVAALITKLARQQVGPSIHESLASHTSESRGIRSNGAANSGNRSSVVGNAIQMFRPNRDANSAPRTKDSIHATTDIYVHREEIEMKNEKSSRGNRASFRGAAEHTSGWDDDLEPLRDGPTSNNMAWFCRLFFLF